MNLHQAYGNRAGSQIAQLQQQNGQPRIPIQQAMRQQQTGPYIKQEDGASNSPLMQDYKPDLSQSAPIKSSQTDGSTDEYVSEIANRRAAITRNQGAGDRLMRAHFRVTQQELEGGGLLVPLDEHQPNIRIVSSRAGAAETGASTLSRAQGDAADDDEVDEDAINSDLDDPDELDDANQEEESVQEVMLCTYDKVQRVKNKWKCTLKDGILRVDGNE
jgi:transcription initiation factor TFIIA large subunit